MLPLSLRPSIALCVVLAATLGIVSPSVAQHRRSPRDEARLVKLLEGSPHRRVRTLAALALGSRVYGEGAHRALLAALDDAEAPVRAAASSALGESDECPSEATLSALERAAWDDVDPAVRGRARVALATLGEDPETRDESELRSPSRPRVVLGEGVGPARSRGAARAALLDALASFPVAPVEPATWTDGRSAMRLEWSVAIDRAGGGWGARAWGEVWSDPAGRILATAETTARSEVATIADVDALVAAAVRSVGRTLGPRLARGLDSSDPAVCGP